MHALHMQGVAWVHALHMQAAAWVHALHMQGVAWVHALHMQGVAWVHALHMQAAAWRQAMHAAACCRLLLPQLLTAALQSMSHAHQPASSGTGGRPHAHLAHAQAALTALAAHHTSSSSSSSSSSGRGSSSSNGEPAAPQGPQPSQQLEQCLERWAAEAGCGQGVAGVPCSQQMQRVEVAAGAAMVAACEGITAAHALLEAEQGQAGARVTLCCGCRWWCNVP